jgi:hydrophobic/amphiphilic exporter-1 (mainly G- bacteria), HAE1 family
MVVSIDRSSGEDLLAMIAAVKKYTVDAKLPPGYDLTLWADQSVDVRDRLDMLISNGMQGLVIVFVMLALFLDLKIAFWVAMGIPFSMLGTGATHVRNRPDAQHALDVRVPDGDRHRGGRRNRGQ